MACSSTAGSPTEETSSISSMTHRKPPVLDFRTNVYRNIWFLAVFLLVIITTSFFTFYSLKKGSPERYIRGVDSWGNLCSRRNEHIIYGAEFSPLDHSQRKYEFHLPFNGRWESADLALYFNRQDGDTVICVKECPKEELTCNDLLIINEYGEGKNSITDRACKKNISKISPHTPFMNQCIPSRLIEMSLHNSYINLVPYLINSISTYLQDIVNVVAINVWSLLYVLVGLRHFLARSIVLLPLFVAICNLILVVFVWCEYIITFVYVEINVDEHLSSEKELGFWSRLLLFRVFHADYLLPLAILVIISMVFVIASFMWCFSKKEMLVTLLREVNKTICYLSVLIIQKIIALFLILATIYYFLVVGIHICFIQESKVEENGMVKFFEERSFSVILLEFFLHFLGTFWILHFIYAYSHALISSAVYHWFFLSFQNAQTVPFPKYCPNIKMALQLLKYNTGSLAFGALLVPFLQFPQLLLEIVHEQVKRRSSIHARFLDFSLRCCFTVLEKILRNISTNNYICVAIYGDGFYEGGKRAVSKIDNIRPRLRLNFLLWAYLMLVRLSITFFAVITGMLYFIAIYHGDESKSYKDFIFPLVVICSLSYCLASFFVNIYSTSADTLYICYADDLLYNNGKALPYVSSEEFQDLMRRRNVWSVDWSNNQSFFMNKENGDDYYKSSNLTTDTIAQADEAEGKQEQMFLHKSNKLTDFNVLLQNKAANQSDMVIQDISEANEISQHSEKFKMKFDKPLTVHSSPHKSNKVSSTARQPTQICDINLPGQVLDPYENEYGDASTKSNLVMKKKMSKSILSKINKETPGTLVACETSNNIEKNTLTSDTGASTSYLPSLITTQNSGEANIPFQGRAKSKNPTV